MPSKRYEQKYGRYLNLKKEMERERVSIRQIAEYLGMSSNNLSLKANGYVAFKCSEMVAIRDKFFPDASLDYLLVAE